MSPIPDPLGIRAATAWVVARARDVHLDEAALDALAHRLRGDGGQAQSWRVAPHWWSTHDPAATAQYVLVLDALNFSFWGEPRWRVRWRGTDLDGYWALAAALRRGIQEGLPLLQAAALRAGLDIAGLLRGEDGVAIPLLARRAEILHEVGAGLEQWGDGQFLRCVQAAHGRAAALVEQVATCFPSFRDVALYEGREVPFYKRAQILAADLWGALKGQPPADFRDRRALTMFADYKVPQVLREMGVLTYSEPLLQRLKRHEEIPSGDLAEVEIRAASVQAVERLCDRLAAAGRRPLAQELDWQLWEQGQTMQMTVPYHRTRTVFY